MIIDNILGKNRFGRDRVFYIAAFISYLSNGIIGPLFIVYLLSINLNPAQIGLILAAQRIGIIFFEFPTGLLADRYGRKISLLISFFFTAILLFIWFYVRDFYALLLLSFVLGVVYTFQSGARESLMVDNLNLARADAQRDSVFTKITMFGNIGFLLGGLIAALLAWYYISTIWLAAAFLNFLLFILFVIFTKEGGSRVDSSDYTTAKETSIFKYIFSNKPVIILIVIAMIFSFLVAVYGLAYPVFLRDYMQIPDYYFGLLGSLSAVLGIIAAWLVNRSLKKVGYYITISCLAVGLMMAYMFFGLAEVWIMALAMFAMVEFFIQGWHPAYQSFFNKFILSKVRSSVLSFSSTATLLAIVVAEVMAGYLLIVMLPGNLLVLAGAAFVFIPILFFTLYRLNSAPVTN